MTWQLIEGSDRLPAVRGKPDASKFTIIRQSTNRRPQIINTFLFEHVAGFDWNNGRSISKLNRWRQQTIRRFQAVLIHERRLPWSAMEHRRLVELMRDALQANGNKRDLLDWEAITRDFNNSFEGVVQKKGEPLARTISTRKKTSQGLCDNNVIDHDRLGSSRVPTALKHQCRRFPDTLKMWEEAWGPQDREKAHSECSPLVHYSTATHSSRPPSLVE